MFTVQVMAIGTMKNLIGRQWEEASLMEDACAYLLQDLPLPPSVPGGMSSYRQSLSLSFFFKFHVSVRQALHGRNIISDGLPDVVSSAAADIPRGPLKSSQLFEIVPNSQADCDPVGRPLAHAAATKHVTGQAIYCDDVPPLANQLHMSLVLSSRAHAEIVSIDTTAALAAEGVHGVFTANDVLEGHNVHGPILHDEEVFASTKVTCCGQVVACVVADTLDLAQRASRLVRVEYKDLSPVIVTIQVIHFYCYHLYYCQS